MRVIAGIAKGRQLKSVTGNNTRPTTDKVKESLFNIINNYIDEGIVLDLFAGTGGLGIEALSRGMKKAIFIDQNRLSIETIKLNVNNCGFTEKAEIYRNDAFRALKLLKRRELKFDLILLDPPYKNDYILDILTHLLENKLVNNNGIIVVEHDSKDKLPDKIEELEKIKTAIYGNIELSIYQLI